MTVVGEGRRNVGKASVAVREVDGEEESALEAANESGEEDSGAVVVSETFLVEEEDPAEGSEIDLEMAEDDGARATFEAPCSVLGRPFVVALATEATY